MRTLGLDVGERRIGMAISDPEGRVAVPVRTYERAGKADAAALAELARAEGVGRIVVGLPISLDGTHGPQAAVSERFAERLRRLTDAEVVLWDERYSSKEADLQLRAMGKNRRKGKSERDAVAASIILQTYLDTVTGGRLPPPAEHDIAPIGAGRQRSRAGAKGGRWTG